MSLLSLLKREKRTSFETIKVHGLPPGGVTEHFVPVGSYMIAIGTSSRNGTGVGFTYTRKHPGRRHEEKLTVTDPKRFERGLFYNTEIIHHVEDDIITVRNLSTKLVLEEYSIVRVE